MSLPTSFMEQIRCVTRQIILSLYQKKKTNVRFYSNDRNCHIFLVPCVRRPSKLSICFLSFSVVYYESIKREIQIKPIYECRCDERLQSKTNRFTRLSYTGLVVELEHLKIKTRLPNEKFDSVMSECVI